MNPSTALARTLVDELVRGGVREAVLAPGSRSAPLAFALHAADAEGRLRLHVRIDERSAAFLALGLAKQSGTPVPVVTTSGTAAANLHPAVIEASYAGVPLLVLTADRPPSLRGTGANQTVDQVKLYGDAVRLFVEVGEPVGGQEAYWRGTACRALSAALGDLSGDPGPVHLNLAFADPLVPDGASWPQGRETAWTTRTSVVAPSVVDDLPDRTLVVLGDLADPGPALALAEARGFPVVAEPSASASGPNVVACGELLAGAGFFEVARPERVLVVGRPTLSRALGRLVSSAPADVVAWRGTWTDAHHHASRVLPAVPTPGTGRSEEWLGTWAEAGAKVAAAVEGVLPDLCEPVVAREVAAAASLLVVGSSKPVRDLLLAAPGPRVLANRGAAGIDGVVSTAVGIALAAGVPTHALLGDLTLLHDANGLVIGPGEPRPDLTVVVTNNDGGAIFGLLEQGAPEHADAFERVFGTPHGVDLAALCAATSTPHALVTSRDELRAALGAQGGVRVVEVRTDRTEAVDLDKTVRAAAKAALTG